MLLSKIFLKSSLIVTVLMMSGMAQAKDKGETLYKLCAACHGDNGEGKVALATPSIAGLPEWYLNRQLSNFKHDIRGKHPKDLGGLKMRPMGRTLRTEEDIKAVAAFVAKMPSVNTKITVKGNVVAGEAAYATCVACHGADGKGNETLNAPTLLISDDWYLLTQLKNFKEKIRGGDAAKDPNGSTMTGMAALLDEKAMEDVVYYIQTMKEKRQR